MQDVAGIVERLLGFLETGKAFVVAETVIQIKDLLRRYPSIAEACLASVSSIAPEVMFPHASCVYVLPACNTHLFEIVLPTRFCCVRLPCHVVVLIFCLAFVQDVVEPEARAAFIWILGEYGHKVQASNACPSHASCTFLYNSICGFPSPLLRQGKGLT